MDLISIRRKYRNIRNTVLIIILLILSVIFVIIFKQIQNEMRYKKIATSYKKQVEQVNIFEQEKEELKKAEAEAARQAKLPKLTEQGKINMSNLYSSEIKKVYLTFDDGPSKGVTLPILDVLKQENVKATFFLLGSRVELYPEIVKRAYEEGHFLASHGYSHIYSQIYESAQSVLDEYNKSLIAIRNAIGEQEYNPHLFRFPGGSQGGKYATQKQEAELLLMQNEILHVDWNSLTADSAGNETAEQFIAELEKTVPKYNCVVVLMHDAGNKKATAEALPQIISYFRERGFEFDNFYSVIK